MKLIVYSVCPRCDSDNKVEVDLAQEKEIDFGRHRLVHCHDCKDSYSVRLNIDVAVKTYRVSYEEVKP